MENIKKLVDKYWKGDTTPEEEKYLKTYFSDNIPSEPEHMLFTWLQNKSEEGIQDENFDQKILDNLDRHASPVNRFKIKFWHVAAAILIIVSSVIVLKYHDAPPPRQRIVYEDSYEDPREAFEETKKALLFISGKMNVSNEYTNKLSEFNKTQERIKQE
jgi:hypothetical protein